MWGAIHGPFQAVRDEEISRIICLYIPEEEGLMDVAITAVVGRPKKHFFRNSDDRFSAIYLSALSDAWFGPLKLFSVCTHRAISMIAAMDSKDPHSIFLSFWTNLIVYLGSAHACTISHLVLRFGRNFGIICFGIAPWLFLKSSRTLLTLIDFQCHDLQESCGNAAAFSYMNLEAHNWLEFARKSPFCPWSQFPYSVSLALCTNSVPGVDSEAYGQSKGQHLFQLFDKDIMNNKASIANCNPHKIIKVVAGITLPAGETKVTKAHLQLRSSLSRPLPPEWSTKLPVRSRSWWLNSAPIFKALFTHLLSVTYHTVLNRPYSRTHWAPPGGTYRRWVRKNSQNLCLEIILTNTNFHTTATQLSVWPLCRKNCP